MRALPLTPDPSPPSTGERGEGFRINERGIVVELIRLENGYKTYHLGEVDAPGLKGVSLVIERGEMIALMGVSGSGKSTRSNILGRLDRPSSGKDLLAGQGETPPV